MNSYMKPRCSTRSTLMRKTRRARCSIGCITRDGKIRKCNSIFHSIVVIGFFILSLTSLLCSLVLKHQPPLFPFYTVTARHLLFFLFMYTPFFSTTFAILTHHIFPSLLAGRGSFSSIIVGPTPCALHCIKSYCNNITVSFSGSFGQDRISLSMIH